MPFPLPVVLTAALRGYLTPKLAMDAALDLGPVVKGVSVATWPQDKKLVESRLREALANRPGIMAKDADIADIVEVLDQLDDVKEEVAGVVANGNEEAPPPEDPMLAPVAKDLDVDMDNDGDVDSTLPPEAESFLRGKLSDADMEQFMMLVCPPAVDKAPDPLLKAPSNMITKPAMDAAIQLAVAESRREVNDLHQARREVKPYIGEVSDTIGSAPAVYKMALDHIGVSLVGVPVSAYRPLLNALPVPGANRPRPAMDAKASNLLEERYPGVKHLKVR